DVSSLGAQIDAGQIKFALKGYLGGYAGDLDYATVFLNFQTSGKTLISQSKLGPVTVTDRAHGTGLLLRSLNGSLPKNTRFVQVQIRFDRFDGGFNDGYADELSLV